MQLQRGAGRIRGTLSLLTIVCVLAGAPRGNAITFDEWRAANFTASELADPAISGPAADPGGHGLVNLLRYTFNLDARNPLVTSAPQLTAAGGEPALVFTPRPGADDVLYVLELSPDLMHWSARNRVWEEPGSTPGSLKWWDVQPPGGNYFLRMRSTLGITAMQDPPSRLSVDLTYPFLGYDVRWSDAATVETGYELQRQTNGGAWTTLVVLPADTITYRDEPIAGNTAYNYRVRALWPDEQTSVWSAQAGGVTPIDTDGDGVPDIWDAYPNDPTRWQASADDSAPVITLTKPFGATLMP